MQFNKICFKIEDALTDDIENIDSEKIRSFIGEYVNMMYWIKI